MLNSIKWGKRDRDREPENNMKKPPTRDVRKAIIAEQTVNQITRSKGGFTLIEIMAAISIIAIVLVSVYKLHAQTLAMNNEVRFYATAAMLAQKKMAEIESKSREDMSADSGDFGEEFPNYNWNIAIDDVVSKALGNVVEDIKRIDITISFNNDEYTYNLRTYKFLQD
jgi:general secretion pathway protein I